MTSPFGADVVPDEPDVGIDAVLRAELDFPLNPEIVRDRAFAHDPADEVDRNSVVLQIWFTRSAGVTATTSPSRTAARLHTRSPGVSMVSSSVLKRVSG
jgi:hypothetical protein